jgi:hypothetical protein
LRTCGRSRKTGSWRQSYPVAETGACYATTRGNLVRAGRPYHLCRNPDQTVALAQDITNGTYRDQGKTPPDTNTELPSASEEANKSVLQQARELDEGAVEEVLTPQDEQEPLRVSPTRGSQP